MFKKKQKAVLPVSEQQADDSYKLNTAAWTDEDEIFNFDYDPARVLYESDFDASLSGWASRTPDPEHYEYGKYEVTAELSGEEKHSGSRSLKIAGRKMNWNGATIDITEYLKPEEYHYEAMVWVKYGEPCTPQRVYLSIETHSSVNGMDFPYFGAWDDYAGHRGILSKYKLPVGCGPDFWDTRYPRGYTTADGWLLLRGKLEIRVAQHERVLVYIETGEDEENSNDIYIDDFVLLRGTSNPKGFRPAPKKAREVKPAEEAKVQESAKLEKSESASGEEFEIKNGELIKYNGSAANVIIPDGVSSIGNDAFAGNSALAGVTIPRGVTSIGRGAFLSTGLTQVIIPDGVLRIHGDAFASCRSLKSVSIPDSVKRIGDTSFKTSNDITEINMSPAAWELFKERFVDTVCYKERHRKQEQEKHRKTWEAEGKCVQCGGDLGMFRKCKSCGVKS
jgi:hypothetical protein